MHNRKEELKNIIETYEYRVKMWKINVSEAKDRLEKAKKKLEALTSKPKHGDIVKCRNNGPLRLIVKIDGKFVSIVPSPHGVLGRSVEYFYDIGCYQVIGNVFDTV